MAATLTDPSPAVVEPVDGLVTRPTGYLALLDLYRVIVCACVLGQHSFLWADMSNNIIGTAFITMLHYTRDAFFLLTGLVVCYAQITRPRTVVGFWIRRYIQLGVPYLAWTCIYVVFTILRPGGAWSQGGTYFWSDLRLGYYQLYVVIVLFQFYLVFPLLLKLLRSTSHHMIILSISVAVALFIGVDLHYHPALGVVGTDIHLIGHHWPWSRNLLGCQEYFVVGAIVAFHFDQVLEALHRWYRQILWVSGAVGVGTLAWYVDVIARGASTGSASDLYEPIATAWAFAAVGGILALSWWWVQRQAAASAAAAVSAAAVSAAADSAAAEGADDSSSSASASADDSGLLRRLARPFGFHGLHFPSVTHLAEITGGFYLCHVLFINMIRAALYSNFVGGEHLPWPIRVAIFYVGTAVVAVAFVALVLRTPLRWVLGGPVRAEQRVRDNREFDLRMAKADAVFSTPLPISHRDG